VAIGCDDGFTLVVLIFYANCNASLKLVFLLIGGEGRIRLGYF
jgi:hypothetical protein